MLHYVNHDAVSDAFAAVEAEASPQNRASILASLHEEFMRHFLMQYERTAYELKKDGWNVGQISDLLGFSERRIKRLVSDYSKRTGAWNLLSRRNGDGAIDISHLVTRRHSGTHRPISVEEHPLPTS